MASEGQLRVTVYSATGLKGDAGLSTAVSVGHGPSAGLSHAVMDGGPNPTYNVTLPFPYDYGSPMEFEVIDQATQEPIAEGIVPTWDAQKNGQWEGLVELDPQGTLKVRMEFVEVPTNPPPKLTITMGKGADFTDERLQEASLKVGLGAGPFQGCPTVRRGSYDEFRFMQKFDFDYVNEQNMILHVVNGKGEVVAEARYDLWAVLNRGQRATNGGLAVFNKDNALAGTVQTHLFFWDPAEIESPPPLKLEDFDPTPRPASPDEPKPVVESPPPQRAFVPAPLPDGALDDLVGAASRDSDAARDAAKAAAVAAGLRPSKQPREAARRAADAAQDAEEAAAEVDRVAEAVARGDELTPREGREDAEIAAAKAADARRRAEADARAAIEAAAEDAVAAAREAERKAVRAADAAAEIAERFPYPEIQERAKEAAAAARKVAEHADKCEAEAAQVRGAPTLSDALDHLRIADKEARAAGRYQIKAEDAARQAAQLARKKQKEQIREDRQRQNELKQLEKEMERANELQRRREAERDAERRKREDLDIHERGVQKNVAAHSYHEDLGIKHGEPVFGLEGGIPPAACCYIPGRQRPVDGAPNYIIEDDGVASRSPGFNQYRYDVRAYGVPDPELDILIEGELRSPMCCMCCGVRWNKC